MSTATPKSQPYGFAYLFERFPSFVQTFVYREAARMAREDVRPWLVSVRRPDDPGNLAATIDAEIFYLPEEKVLRAEVDALRTDGRLGWRARRIIPRRRSEKDSQRMFEAIWLASELKKRGIRHVHAHFGGLATRTAWWLNQLFGISYSFTGHANDIFCDTNYPVSNGDLANDAKFIVTETDFARRWMEERHPKTRGKVFRVFNGIDPTGFFDREQPAEIPRLISVGRYVEKKGFDVLIDACARLAAEGIHFTCEIIGEGPLEALLAERIERHGLVDRVCLLGPRSQEQVRKELARSDVFVLACQPDSEGGSDNLPTVIAEAMFTGLPCISTRLAGVPEMITDGVDGMLTEPKDPEGLATAIRSLLRDPVRAARLGQAGKTSALGKFSIEHTVGELRRLLIERARVPSSLSSRSWWRL